MPALPPYPNVMRIQTLWTVGADLNVESTIHLLWTGSAPSNATCVALATSTHAQAVTWMVPELSVDNDLRGIIFTDLTTDTAGTGEFLTTVPGSKAGDPNAASVCALSNFGISRRYRGGKPRVYWPIGTADDLLSPSLWKPASVTAFEAAINGYMGAVQGLSSGGTTMGALVNISYYQGFTAVVNPITGRTRDVPKVRTVGIAPDLVTSSLVNPKPGSQRRRLLHS